MRGGELSGTQLGPGRGREFIRCRVSSPRLVTMPAAARRHADMTAPSSRW